MIKRGSRVVVVVLGTLAGACSTGAPPAPAPAPATEDGGARRSARTLEVPGPTPQGDANAGHTVLHWEPPADWVPTPPASSMRLAQYRVPGPGGDAECIVFYFGPGQGGDPMSNAVRWASQFRQPDGQPSVERMVTTRIEGTPIPTHIVEVAGIYDGGMTMTDAPAAELAGYMLLGGIVEAPDAPWFFKLTGPEVTVRSQREAFVRMLRAAHLDE